MRAGCVFGVFDSVGNILCTEVRRYATSDVRYRSRRFDLAPKQRPELHD